MNSVDFVAKYGKIYLKYLENERNEDYEINYEQLGKFADIMNFYKDLIAEIGGKVDEVELEPKIVSGGLTVSFVVFDIVSHQIERFCDVMRHASAITIDTTADSRVCISITVPNVFRRKGK